MQRLEEAPTEQARSWLDSLDGKRLERRMEAAAQKACEFRIHYHVIFASVSDFLPGLLSISSYILSEWLRHGRYKWSAPDLQNNQGVWKTFQRDQRKFQSISSHSKFLLIVYWKWVQ